MKLIAVVSKLVVIGSLLAVPHADAQITAFTYQGRLTRDGGPANGTYDLRFTLYGAPLLGSPLTGAQTLTSVPVSNGLFTVALNFGAGQFNGPGRWLEIAVGTNGAGGAFETLTPRQPITPTPYALYSAAAGNVTGPIADSLLSSNIARLQSSPTFTGTVTAASFSGNGALLTGITGLDSASNGPPDALTVDRFGHVAIGTNDSGAALQVAGGTNVFLAGELELIAVVTNGYLNVSNFVAPVNVFTEGPRAYVTTYFPGTLHIFNVANPHEPQFIGDVVDDAARPGSPFTKLGGASGLFVTNGVAYVTSENEHAVTIINVINSRNPIKIAEIVDGSNGFNGLNLATGVLVSGTNLFVLGFWDSALSIINVANPANPQLIREIYDDSTMPGSPFTKLQWPYQMTLVGTRLYIAARGDHAITILDVADPANPQIVGEIVDDSVNPGSPFTKLANVNWVEVVGNVAYAVSGAFNSVGDHSLTLIDVSNPANPLKLAEVTDDSLEPNSPFKRLRGGWAVKVSRNTAFVTCFGDNALSVIDVSEPTNPRLLRELVDGAEGINTLSFTEGISIRSNIVYVAGDGDSAVNVFEIPTRPLGLVVDGLVGIGTDTPRSALDVAGTIRAESIDVDGFLNATGEGRFGSLSAMGSVMVDQANANSGAVQPGLVFGANRTEGIASRRTPGGANANGLDFFAGLAPRMSLTAGGLVGIGTQNPQTHMHVYSGFNPTTLRLQSAAGPGFGRIEFYSDPQFSANEWRPGYIQSTDNGGFTGGIAFVVNGTGFANRLNAIEVMRIVNGAVGIGTFAPGFTLHVNGSAGKPGGGSWTVASDARLKKDIHPLHDALGRLLRLRGVTFEYVDPKAIHELPGRQTGMVAQEVEKVFPEWIETRSDGTKCLSVRGFEALTVEALRELREEKDREIERIKAHANDLEKRLTQLERVVSTLKRN